MEFEVALNERGVMVVYVDECEVVLGANGEGLTVSVFRRAEGEDEPVVETWATWDELRPDEED